MLSLFVVSLFGFAVLVLLFAGALVSSSAPNFGLLRPSFVFVFLVIFVSRRAPDYLSSLPSRVSYTLFALACILCCTLIIVVLFALSFRVFARTLL